MPSEVSVAFAGPFSWMGAPDAPSVFDAEQRRDAGIYLWTVPQSDGYLIYYVGETGRNFGIRLLEHYTEHAAAMYHVYSPPEFARGQKIALWPGRFDATDCRSAKECIAQYSKLCGPISELTAMFRFFLAPTSCDDRSRRRIEAAIASSLYEVPGIVGGFQDRGIRYDHRRDDEEPIECVVSTSACLLGMPDRLSA